MSLSGTDARGDVEYLGKRMLGLSVASIACVAFAPACVAIAVAISLDDGESPFFLQTRVGRSRRPFRVFKFRSMQNGQVTRIGAFLRRTGLDELPQLVNVLQGEMSIVGPRPLTSADVERLGWNKSSYDWRFATRPGITGLSQLLAGRGVRMSRRLDRLYLHRQSPALDTQLIALSFVANLFGKRVASELLGQPRNRVDRSRLRVRPRRARASHDAVS